MSKGIKNGLTSLFSFLKHDKQVNTYSQDFPGIPPRISGAGIDTPLTAQEGEPLTIKVFIDGTPAPTKVVWYLGEREIKASKDFRTEDNGYEYNLHIKHVAESLKHKGIIVTARNHTGYKWKKVDLLPYKVYPGKKEDPNSEGHVSRNLQLPRKRGFLRSKSHSPKLLVGKRSSQNAKNLAEEEDFADFETPPQEDKTQPYSSKSYRATRESIDDRTSAKKNIAKSSDNISYEKKITKAAQLDYPSENPTPTYAQNTFSGLDNLNEQLGKVCNGNTPNKIENSKKAFRKGKTKSADDLDERINEFNHSSTKDKKPASSFQVEKSHFPSISKTLINSSLRFRSENYMNILSACKVKDKDNKAEMASVDSKSQAQPKAVKSRRPNIRTLGKSQSVDYDEPPSTFKDSRHLDSSHNLKVDFYHQKPKSHAPTSPSRSHTLGKENPFITSNTRSGTSNELSPKRSSLKHSPVNAQMPSSKKPVNNKEFSNKDSLLNAVQPAQESETFPHDMSISAERQKQAGLAASMLLGGEISQSEVNLLSRMAEEEKPQYSYLKRKTRDNDILAKEKNHNHHKKKDKKEKSSKQQGSEKKVDSSTKKRSKTLPKALKVDESKMLKEVPEAKKDKRKSLSRANSDVSKSSTKSKSGFTDFIGSVIEKGKKALHRESKKKKVPTATLR